jgi:hypothetical protein
LEVIPRSVYAVDCCLESIAQVEIRHGVDVDVFVHGWGSVFKPRQRVMTVNGMIGRERGNQRGSPRDC